MNDVLTRLSLIRDAMGPEERKVALWMGLIGMWACGYVIESSDERDCGSSTIAHRAREAAQGT